MRGTQAAHDDEGEVPASISLSETCYPLRHDERLYPRDTRRP
jgi:hypothetical protein